MGLFSGSTFQSLWTWGTQNVAVGPALSPVIYLSRLCIPNVKTMSSSGYSAKSPQSDSSFSVKMKSFIKSSPILKEFQSFIGC